ncbi:rhomboid family intramembrane serine protease [Natronobacterium gregoryi]|uniref:Membrane protein n=2 Tax=Natronobacterium gregoryi TaxID=44930 RepID=L0AGF3_NATGS|nr:rhomboid family intramembrane serine protease [Natronobacterium gregoryi]AFZ72130.1 putative membrane protein [Natronobacterium gregoryi SP2]ELY62840.1 rhomboid family protein [Natronobacterium gregoryi SP2]PLK19267.1 rhomboid family intramembrane serine protease [Natronobacterium gregoryi SP2]SFJ54810.1 Membrane associated serine protease, rhomboid family [Natronobacterium gregoryi]
MSSGKRNRPRTRSPSDATPNSRPDRGANATGDETPGSGSPLLEVLAVFFVVYVLQQVTSLLGVMTGLFVLSPPLATNPWTIVTSVYAHGGLGHLVSNSLALIVFGWAVARATTRLRFHLFFVGAGALAGIAQILVTGAAATLPLLSVTPTGSVLGASGAVFALLGYLVASNRLAASFASIVEIPRWFTILVFVGLATAVTLATAAPHIALIAHFTGFLLGLIAGRARVLQVE